MQDDDDDLTIEFDEPIPQRSWGGFNPSAAGYRSAAGRRRVLWMALCAAVACTSGCLWLAGQWRPWLAPVGVAAAVVVAATMEWMWRRSSFCSACGARAKGPFSASARAWCPACYNLTNPAKIVSGPVGLFDLTGPDYLLYEDPIAKFLCYSTLIAVKDGAHEIRFEPEEGAYEIRIAIGDDVYDLVPPPSWFHFPAAQAIKAIAGLDLAVCDQRQEGRMDVIADPQRLVTEVVVEPTRFGQRVVLRFSNNRAVELSAAAQARLAEVDAEIEAKLKAEIASRPKGLRLPNAGGRFRAMHDVEVDLITQIRDPDIYDGVLPFDFSQCVLPKGEVLRLDGAPDPSKSSQCELLPERYDELENRLVEAKWREEEYYAGYRLSVSYVQLDADFEWLQSAD